MKINNVIRKKAFRRTQALRMFKKLYFLYGTLTVISFIACVATHLAGFAVFFLGLFFLALFTAIVHLTLDENIEGNKPLTRKQRRRSVFVLDIVNEKSYFQIQYLEPSTKVKDLCLG